MGLGPDRRGRDAGGPVRGEGAVRRGATAGASPRPAGLGTLDHRLLQAVVRLATGAEGQEEGDALFRRYLDEEISLAKLAETLEVSRFELQESFERLGVPVRLGPATLEEARDEVKVARDVE